MSFSKHAFRFMVALAALLIPTPQATAQESPVDYVIYHNSARFAVGNRQVGWDQELADYAQNYANDRQENCELVNSGGPYGENIFLGMGREFTALDAVLSWVSERQYYDYSSNSCAAGKVCGHYAQVVWAETMMIGCGRVKCSSGAYFIICSYYPPANQPWERPYETLDDA
uniref:Cysteine-rich secretory protein n=1 Tax=Tradescantia hirsutiflora TaxID=428262 RepID=A0A1B1X424_9LILI|nr:cysteine-rich secretory protein [Tradescantia hirsutiflora]